jgi:hypothetical protein
VSGIVKVIEWEDRWSEYHSMSGTTRRRIMERGLTPFAAYSIEQSPDDDSWWLLDRLLGDEIGGPFEHGWQARSAAQTHFDEKVLSALDPSYASPQAEIERLRKALSRQCDNMAFVVNHVTLHGWYDKFKDELEEDRAALSGSKE